MKRFSPKVVLDTNIIISSLWGGNPRKIIDKWQEEKIIVITSLGILDEYMNVIDRFNPESEIVEEFILLFTDRRKTLFVKPQRGVTIIKEDPADNKFLTCADEGNAEYIISGDKHLLNLSLYKKTIILSPKDFLFKIEMP